MSTDGNTNTLIQMSLITKSKGVSSDPSLDCSTNKKTNFSVTDEPQSGMHGVSNVLEADSAAGMACGTAADMKTNIHSQNCSDTPIDEFCRSKYNSYDVSYSIDEPSQFSPKGLRLNDNLVVIDFLKYHNIGCEQHLDKKKNLKNRSGIEFLGNRGENPRLIVHRLEDGLIRDVISGALGGGLVAEFGHFDKSLLYSNWLPNEIHIYEYIVKKIISIASKSGNPAFLVFMKILIMEKWRKLYTLNFAYMLPACRSNSALLEWYADEVKLKLFEDLNCEELHLGLSCCPPQGDNWMFVATLILKRAVDFLCSKYSELMTGIESNRITFIEPVRPLPEKQSVIDLAAMDLLEFQNAKQFPDKETILSNPFDVEFLGNHGEMYRYTVNQLDDCLINDVISGALGGGKVPEFTTSDKALLINISSRSESQIFEYICRLLFCISLKSEISDLRVLLELLMKKWRKLVTVHFAYMLPICRRNVKNLRLFVEQLKSLLFKHFRWMEIHLSYELQEENVMLSLAPKILYRAIEFLSIKYRALMTNIESNRFNTHVRYNSIRRQLNKN